MDLNISFLTFSPRVKKSNKKIFVDRKIPKLCLKRKISSPRGSKEDHFHNKWASPSSLNNVHKMFKSKESSGRKEAVKKKLHISRGKENYVVFDKSLSRSKPSRGTCQKSSVSNSSANDSKCERNIVSEVNNVRIPSCSLNSFEKNRTSSNDTSHFEMGDQPNSSRNKQVSFTCIPLSVETQKHFAIEHNKDSCDGADDDSDSVIIISDTSACSLDDSFTIRRKNISVKWKKTIIEISSSNNSSFLQKSKDLVNEVPDTGDTLGNSARMQSLIKENSGTEVGRNDIPPVGSQTGILSSSRINDIEKWLENNVFPSSPPLSKAISTVPQPQSKWQNRNTMYGSSDDSGSTGSAERLLNNLYGTTWQKDKVLATKSKTEPRKLKRNVKGDKNDICNRRFAASTKVSSSSDSDEDFDRFLHNIRQNFESTRHNVSTPGTPFINDESLANDSVGFYIANSNNNKINSKKTQSDRKKNISTTVPKRLFTFEGDSSSSSEEKTKKTISRSDPKKVGGKYPGRAVNFAKPKAPAWNPTSSPPKVLSFLRSLSASPPAAQCHPRAEIFKADFKNNKEKLSTELFGLYNRVVFDNKLPSNMKVEWNIRMNRTAGFCYNRRAMTPSKQSIRSSRIELSTKVCDTPDRLRDTLIHEMCHAAAWVINNSKGGHGPQWKTWATKAMQRFPDLPPIRRCHDYKIQFKYTYKCIKCGYSIGRHSKSLNLATKRCGYCLGTFEILVNAKSKKVGNTCAVTSTPRTPRNPTGFALFVKENYRTVKKSRSDLKHGEVMKLLGQQFSAVKLGPASVKL